MFINLEYVMQGAITCLSTLNVSRKTAIQSTTCLSTFNVSGATLLNNVLTISPQISSVNILRIAGASSDGASNAISTGGYGMITVDSPGVVAGRLKLDESGYHLIYMLVGWDKVGLIQTIQYEMEIIICVLQLIIDIQL